MWKHKNHECNPFKKYQLRIKKIPNFVINHRFHMTKTMTPMMHLMQRGRVKKDLVAASTVAFILYLSFCLFINQTFHGSRFTSLCTIEPRFGLLGVCILILILCHCSLDTVECSADRLMRSASAI